MLYFLDTEFFEDGSTIDLISLALVAGDGRELYLCSREARLDLVGDWHREHVLPKLPPLGDSRWVCRQEMADQIVLFTGQSVPVRDGGMTSREPAVRDDSKAHFVAYYASYDWVCLCQLFNTMMSLPGHFIRWCYDLKQLAFDRGISTGHPSLMSGLAPVLAHDALADARWNRDMYAKLMAVT